MADKHRGEEGGGQVNRSESASQPSSESQSQKENLDFSTERREFQHGELRRDQLDDSPVQQFQRWLMDAKEAGIKDATAMALATVDQQGQPFQRMVLLKGLDERGFVFFTNLDSRKAGQIANNALVSLHFGWLVLDRQVIIRGQASRLSVMDDARYFLTRPRESQLAAWASHQSHPVTARRLLTEKFLEVKQRFASGDVPVPHFWGGFRVEPSAIEFWQGRENRMHDRFEYNRLDGGDWAVQRLSP